MASWTWLRLATSGSGTKGIAALAISAPYLLPLQFVLICQLQDECHVSGSFASDSVLQRQSTELFHSASLHRDVRVTTLSPGFHPTNNSDNSSKDMTHVRDEILDANEILTFC